MDGRDDRVPGSVVGCTLHVNDAVSMVELVNNTTRTLCSVITTRCYA